MGSKELARKARIKTLEIVSKSNSSHIGSSLSIIDILSVLYCDFINFNNEHPNDNKNSNRFILSKGHACSAVYSILGLLKYFPIEKLETYGQNNSDFMTHISHKVPGVYFSTGSLGHGLPFGLGKALAAKRNNLKWDTFVLLSDGEMQEGSNWEALMFAGHHKVDNLVAIIDYNNLQSLSTVENTLNIEPLSKKLESFGCHVLKVDGHDHRALKESFAEAKIRKNKPTVMIANTIKGKGVGFMENKVEWHYRSPTSEQLQIAIKDIENA